MHQCKLPRMIELEAGNALSGRCDGRLRELSQLTAINEGFQNVLLDVVATEDHGDLIRLTDCLIGIEQALAKIIQSRAAMEDEVVAIFDLREEQPVLAAVLAFSCSEEGREV